MAKLKTATRTLSNAGRLRTLVVATSRKAVGPLGAESLVEYDGLLELVADPDIVSVQVQPETVRFVMGGRPVTYTPDVRFVRRDGRIGYREFKLNTENLPPELDAKLAIAQEYFTEQGFEFEVREAAAFRRGFRIDNLRLLKRYEHWPTSQVLQRRVLAFVEAHDEVCLQDLRDHVGAEGLGALYRMVWERQLDVDLESARLCAATVVRRLRP